MNIDKSLDEVLDWVEYKLEFGQEPPWAWQEYTKLKESILKVQKGRESVILMDDLQQSDSRLENGHQQAEKIVQLDSFRCHQVDEQVCLPM